MLVSPDSTAATPSPGDGPDFRMLHLANDCLDSSGVRRVCFIDQSKEPGMMDSAGLPGASKPPAR